VAQRFPEGEPPLRTTAFAFAEVQASTLSCSHLHVAHAHRMRGHRWVDADDTHSIRAMQRKVLNRSAAASLHREHLLEGPVGDGRALTVCDAYLFTLAQWLETDGVVPSRIRKLIDHRAGMFRTRHGEEAIAAETT